jgi:hypothetical protein
MASLLLVSAACNPFAPAYSEKITLGQQFAHNLRFPSPFEYPVSADRNLYFDHLTFRLGASPNTLVVSACGYPELTEVCSTNVFLVDIARNYGITRAPLGAWQSATAIPGASNLRDPHGFTSAPLSRVTSNGFVSGETVAWTFRGINFPSRGTWVTGLTFMASGDGKLVFIAGVDKRKLPGYAVLVGDPVSGGAYGNYMLDVFDSTPDKKLAAIDVDCRMASLDCMAPVSVVNSRWFAIGLARDLSKAVLFDFGS